MGKTSLVALSLLKKLKMSKLSLGYCAGGCFVGSYVSREKLLMDELLFEKYKPVLAYSDIFNLLMAVLGIPLYYLLFYPFLYNHIPTMLKRIGFGLLLLLCSFIMYAIVGNVLLCSSLTSHAYFSTPNC